MRVETAWLRGCPRLDPTHSNQLRRRYTVHINYSLPKLLVIRLTDSI